MRAVEEDYATADIVSTLTPAALESGLDAPEVRATIRSGVAKAEREGKRGRLVDESPALDGLAAYEAAMADPIKRAELERLIAQVEADLAAEARADGLTAEERLASCVETFREWLHFPDPSVLYIVLAAMVANEVREDDPVWPLIVGSPGSGKTEVLASISGQPNVYQAATMTEPALLSGTSKRERSKTSKGGLLRQVGAFGILVLKDFGSVLSMAQESRGQMLAALREIYDGSWTRQVGTDGGQELHWEGKLGLLAGCTPAIDSHHAVMGSMGERFVLYRVPTTENDDREQVRRSLERTGDHAMRRALAEAVSPVLAAARGMEMPATADPELREWLVELSTFAVRCRSAVERDYRTREIELIPPPEMPARLGLVLWRVFRALRVLGVTEPEARRLLAKMALDSMPAARRAVLEELRRAGDELMLSRIADNIHYPKTTARRALEDLNAHGVVERDSGPTGRADVWWLSDWTRDRLAAIWPGDGQ